MLKIELKPRPDGYSEIREILRTMTPNSDESILVPTDSGELERVRSGITHSANRAGIMKIKRRTEYDRKGNIIGLRFWRVE
jgi:hypothetical protein